MSMLTTVQTKNILGFLSPNNTNNDGYSFLRALNITKNQSPDFVATDPMLYHPWVFAAAQTIATTAAAAQFRVFKEVSEPGTTNDIDSSDVPRGFRPIHTTHWTNRVIQSKRMASQEVPGHRIQRLVEAPNPLMRGEQLLYLTYLWMSTTGEYFWIKADEKGRRPQPGADPETLWPIPGCWMEPIFKGGLEEGEVIGWEMKVPNYIPFADRFDTVTLSNEEVIQFKTPNPYNPIRGTTKLSAVATAILSDLNIERHNRSLLANDAIPRGLISTEFAFENSQERQTFVEQWQQNYAGPQNSGKVAVLERGMKFQNISMSPKEMEFDVLEEKNRDKILATMGVPPSAMGLQQAVSYATAIVWNLQFWERTILPIMRTIERVIDQHLFQNEDATLFAMHDLSGVDALRAGVLDKANAAKALCGRELHMDPRTALGIVGLDIPEYVGWETSFVEVVLTTAQRVIDGENVMPSAEPQNATGDSGGELSSDSDGADTDNTSSPEKSGEEMISIFRKWIALIKADKESGKAGDISDYLSALFNVLGCPKAKQNFIFNGQPSEICYALLTASKETVNDLFIQADSSVEQLAFANAMME